MKRSIWLLTLTLLIQTGLAVALNMGGGDSGDRDAARPLLARSPLDSDTVLIADSHSQVRLHKKDGKWLLPDHFQAPADSGRIQRLLSGLATAKRGWPVATTSEAASRFKVDAKAYERKLVLTDSGGTTTLYLGSSPGYRRIYARLDGEDDILTLEMGLYDLPVDADQWVDPELFTIDRDTVTAIEFPGFALDNRVENRNGNEDKDKTKNENENKKFILRDPGSGQVDQTRIDALVRAVTDPRINGVLGRTEKPEFHLDKPVLRFTVVRDKGDKRVCRLGRLDKDQGFALACSDIPFIGRLAQWAAQPLLKADRQSLLKNDGEKASSGQIKSNNENSAGRTGDTSTRSGQ